MTNRKRKNKGLIALLLDSPWQVSVIVSASAYILLQWIIPSQLSHSKILISLVGVSKGFAPFTCLFLIPGLIVYFKQSKTPSNELVNLSLTVPVYTNTISIHSSNKLKTPTPKVEVIEVPTVKAEWSLNLLKEVEWKRYELLCAEYFRCLGKRVETISHGADGGIDARIYSDKTNELEYVIQCKSWNSLVGVKPIRELFGVMNHEVAGKGIFMTTSDFTVEAKQFAAEHSSKIFLINGDKFLSMILKLAEVRKEKLLAFATEGDYKTPSCPSCGIKLVKRITKTKSFWGCGNFPKCRTTMHIDA